jgi:hypothetical protein
VLAVLVRFTDYTTQLFTVFYCRLHESVLQSFHYTRFWPPDVVCRGGLRCPLFLKASYSSTGCFFRTDFSALSPTDFRTARIRWLSATLSHSLRLTASSTLTLRLYLRLSSTVLSLSVSESYVTTDGQSASQSWNKAPIWGLRPDSYYRRTVAGLLMWGALSDERTGLSFTVAAGPSQRSHSLVRAPWDSRPFLTVSDLRLPISSPPTTRRVTVTYIVSMRSHRKHRFLCCIYSSVA